MTQDIAVFILLALISVYLIFSAIKKSRCKSASKCSGCSGCSLKNEVVKR